MNKWIPVSERLPEGDAPVIAYYGFDDVPTILEVGVEHPKDFSNELYGHTISHWMPLPPPPEKIS